MLKNWIIMSDNDESNKNLNGPEDQKDKSDFTENIIKGFSQTILKIKEWRLLAIESLIELDPKNPTHYYEKGNVLVELKRYDEAILEYEKAIEINENDPYFHNNLAYAFSKINRYIEALSEIETAIRLNPKDVICNLTYAEIMSLIDNDYEGIKKISYALNNGLINKAEFLKLVNQEISEDISEKERKLLKKILETFS